MQLQSKISGASCVRGLARNKQIAPFSASRKAAVYVRASAQSSESTSCTSSRRQLLQLALLPATAAVIPGAAQAANKAPKGFNVVQDLADNYQFLYPFGWQEVSVATADVVYKDVVEPLESVSVTITDTDKSDITEFGEINEVCETLAKLVLTPPNQEVKVLATTQRESKGHNLFEVEFTAASSKFTRHSLAVVGVANGKFYTMTTGANEKRWGKMKDKLSTSAKSFSFVN